MNIRNKMFLNNNVFTCDERHVADFHCQEISFCYFSIEYYLHIYTMYNEYFITSMNPQYWRFYTDIIVVYA